MTGDVDSSSPVIWNQNDGVSELFVVTSTAGQPSRAIGEDLSHLGDPELVQIEPWPLGGVWMEAVIPDVTGTWYGFYHNELTADMCGDVQKAYTRIGAARSEDQGATWTNLGIILEAPQDTFACDTINTYFVGGVGDFTALLDADRRDVYIYFSQYGREASQQGIAVARLPWADVDEPVGKLTVWNDGVWLPPDAFEDDNGELHWVYPPAAVLLFALIWPTCLMGASLPLLARGLTNDVRRAAATVGALYGANTLGAAIGALGTTFSVAAAPGWRAASVWRRCSISPALRPRWRLRWPGGSGPPCQMPCRYR